jgi:hypothetical protein
MGRQIMRRLRGPRSRAHLTVAAVVIGLVGQPGPTIGPYDIPLYATPKAPAAQGHGRLAYADSPFGVALTRDGHALYDIHITASALPTPSSLGAFSTYVAWVATPDLAHWARLGPVANGNTTLGPVDLDKFLLVVTAESDSTANTHAGPTVLHGISPSSLLQKFLTKPAFHGIVD